MRRRTSVRTCSPRRDRSQLARNRARDAARCSRRWGALSPRRRYDGSPVGQRARIEALKVAAAHVERRVLQQALLWKRALHERSDVFARIAERGEPIGHAGGPHELDETSAQDLAGVIE